MEFYLNIIYKNKILFNVNVIERFIRCLLL